MKENRRKKNIKIKPFFNFSIVKEEEGGYGTEFNQRHITYISNPEIRAAIRHMSVMETIG